MTGKGRKGIGSQDRQHYSTRSMTGDLEVIRMNCPYCGHHKALENKSGEIKCSRCKLKIR